MKIKWIPREEDEIVEEISKLIYLDDWQLTHEFFKYLKRNWVTFSIHLESSPLHLDHLVSSLKESVKQQHLKQLAKKVPNIIRNSSAVNTFKKYSTYFNQWKNLSKNFSLPFLPVKEEHVALYLTSLIQNQKSSANIKSTYYAIEHLYKLSCKCLSSPIPILQMLADPRSCKKRETVPKQKRLN